MATAKAMVPAVTRPKLTSSPCFDREVNQQQVIPDCEGKPAVTWLSHAERQHRAWYSAEQRQLEDTDETWLACPSQENRKWGAKGTL